jgi:aldose 1-epimerase
MDAIETNREFKITSRLFGTFEKKKVFLYTISNGTVDIDVMNFGGIITRINIPDRNGVKHNVVAGFDNFQNYIDDKLYLGCIVGRHANRIKRGTFTFEGISYQLSLNDGENHLHGGFEGFNKKIWTVEAIINEEHRKGIIFSYLSKDGEEGYPGNLKVWVSYILTSNNELIIRYQSTTDKPTIVSLTNHSYFNLSGFKHTSIEEHELTINSEEYLVQHKALPNGEISSVENSLLDFRGGKKIGECLYKLTEDKGLNHCFVLAENPELKNSQMKLYDHHSGRAILVKTNQPAVQVYTSNYWDGSIKNETGHVFGRHSAIAIETQSFTDAPNHSGFANSVLYPGDVYDKTTIFQFVTD